MKKTTALLTALVLGCTLSAQDLKKSVTWENIVSNPAPLPVVGQLKTVTSDLNRPSFWSVGCETMDRDCRAELKDFAEIMGFEYYDIR